MKARFPLVFWSTTLALLGMLNCVDPPSSSTASTPVTPRKDFTPQEVSEIKAMLAERNPSTYRVTLPVYRNEQVIDSETIGTLSVREVERLASLQGIQLQGQANLQMILNSSGGSGGSGGSAGADALTNPRSGGDEVINRVDSMARGLESSNYSFIH